MPQEDPTQLPEGHEFDFLEGEWEAACRFPRPDGSWGEGPGTLKATKIFDGRQTKSVPPEPSLRRAA